MLLPETVQRACATDEIEDSGLKACPCAAGVLEFQTSGVVADAVAIRAGSRAEVEVRIGTGRAAEEGVAEDGERVDAEAAVLHLVDRADVDGCGDVVARRRGGGAGPCCTSVKERSARRGIRKRQRIASSACVYCISIFLADGVRPVDYLLLLIESRNDIDDDGFVDG